jgi:hypothetical protein
LLLRLEERLLLPLLPEDARLPLLRALARSLWALLFCVLALPPLLAACPRLILPEEEDGDDLPDEEEDEELRDAIACSIGRLNERPPVALAATRSI